jgi:hypothetical protein
MGLGYSICMENKGFIERVPVAVLAAVLAVCGIFNAMFLLTMRNHRGMQISDSGQGAACGVFLGIQLLCVLAMWMKKQLAT